MTLQSRHAVTFQRLLCAAWLIAAAFALMVFATLYLVEGKPSYDSTVTIVNDLPVQATVVGIRHMGDRWSAARNLLYHNRYSQIIDPGFSRVLQFEREGIDSIILIIRSTAGRSSLLLFPGKNRTTVRLSIVIISERSPVPTVSVRLTPMLVLEMFLITAPWVGFRKRSLGRLLMAFDILYLFTTAIILLDLADLFAAVLA